MGKLLIVFIGGGLGSGARYVVATWAVALTLLGCLVTGALGLASARLIVRVASDLAV